LHVHVNFNDSFFEIKYHKGESPAIEE